MKRKYFFLNVIDGDISKFYKYSRLIEEEFDKNTLTSLNFAHTSDENYLLALVFMNEKARNQAKKISEQFSFMKTYINEENWQKLIPLTKICIIGSFSHKMLEGDLKNG